MKSWSTPIRGGVCIEGGELGRLNYYSEGMIRGEIECTFPEVEGSEKEGRPDAILILNEAINHILELRLPQRPKSKIVIGIISGGINHGKTARFANLGFEIRSDSYKMVKSIYNDISSIVEGLNHENEVGIKIKTISNLKASRLRFDHPLVKSAAAVMKKLDLTPFSKPTESELAIFLTNRVPAITLGITHGEDYYMENARMEIEPMFKGICQLIGVLMAIDSGVCDGPR